jgi:hypothetical protein
MDIVLEKMHYKLDKYRKKTIKRSRSNLKWWGGGEREIELPPLEWKERTSPLLE